MSLKTLELDRFSLTNPENKWKLEVVSSADFNIPETLSSAGNYEALRLLTSKQIWASRGKGCRFDIHILWDAKPLDWVNRVQLLRTFGCQLRDAVVSFPENL